PAPPRRRSAPPPAPRPPCAAASARAQGARGDRREMASLLGGRGSRLMEATTASDSDSGAELLERSPISRGALARGAHASAGHLGRRIKAAGLVVFVAGACVCASSIWSPRAAAGSRGVRLGKQVELAAASSPARALRDAKVCHDNEEKWGLLCYKKCSLLTDGMYPIRTTAMTCCESHPCKLNQVHKMGVCGGFSIAGDGESCPHPPGDCFPDEDSSSCYSLFLSAAS
ncbi:unnamed protein product, partial [Prorocentrum cordatum]